MRFLTRPECQDWCNERHVPLRKMGWIRPNISDEHFHIVNLPYPNDSARQGATLRIGCFL